MGEAVSHVAILAAVERLTADVAEISAKLGAEDIDPETGQVVATGLMGRFRSYEARQQTKDQEEETKRLRWINRALIVSLSAAGSAFAAIVVWLAGDRLEATRDLVRKAPEIQAQTEAKTPQAK